MELLFGWVHNQKKFWGNNYYYAQNGTINGSPYAENYFGCQHDLSSQNAFFIVKDLDPNKLYDVQFFPTRLGQTAVPNSLTNVIPYGGGSLIELMVDITGTQLGCDKLNSDFAFVIKPSAGFQRKSNPSVHDNSKSLPTFDFVLYPNPAITYFTLFLPSVSQSQEHFDFFIYDATGREVYYKINVPTGQVSIEVTNFEVGVYFVKAIYRNESIFKRIIIH